MGGRKMYVVVALLVGLALTAFICSQAFTQPAAGMEKPKAQEKEPAKMACPVCKMHADSMKMQGQVAKLLTEAKAAIDAKDMDTASAKIAAAQKLISDHQKMMSETMTECPMCHMKWTNEQMKMKEGGMAPMKMKEGGTEPMNKGEEMNK